MDGRPITARPFEPYCATTPRDSANRSTRRPCFQRNSVRHAFRSIVAMLRAHSTMCALVGMLGLVSWSGTARAQSVSLTWTAPAGCPTEADVIRRANAISRGSERGPSPSRARVERTPSGTWHLHIEGGRVDGAWSRDVEAESCDAAADTTALLAAIGEPTTPLAPRPFGQTPTPLTSRPKANESPPGFWRSLRIAPGVAAESGANPTATLGGVLALAWSPSALRAEFEAGAWAEQTAFIPERTELGGKFRLVNGRLRGCALPRWRWLSLGACTGVELSNLRAEATGPTTTGNNDATWFSATAGFLSLFHLTHGLALRAGLDGGLPLSRMSLVISNGGTVHRIATPAIRASFGVEVGLP
jgi:hypothetical protein